MSHALTTIADAAALGRTLADAFANELASVVSALIDTAVAAVPSEAPVQTRWSARLRFRGAITGTVIIGFSGDDASRLARLITGTTDIPSDDAVADAVKELIGQAAGSLGQKPEAFGAQIDVEALSGGSPLSPSMPSVVFELAMAGDFVPRIACWTDVQGARTPGAPALAPEPRTPGATPNLDVILDIDLPLTVRFGHTDMTLHALSRLAPGSVIDLNRSPDDPVDVLVNGRMVARGEVVVVAGNYGVRITEVVSALDRIRTMGTN